MAITTEELAQLKADFEAGTLSADHSLIKPLSELGLVFRTPKQEEDFKANYAQQVTTGYEAKAYTNVEKAVFESTGIEKKANEKASDYVNRAFNEDKTVRTTLKTELDELKAKRTDGDATKEDKTRITALEKLLETQKGEFEAKLTNAEKAIVSAKAQNSKDAALAQIKTKLKPSLDKEIVGDLVAIRTQRFDEAFSPKVKEDGSIVWVNKEGEEQLNTTTYKPKTAEELMSDFFKDLFDTGKKQEGAGSNGKGKAGKQAETFDANSHTLPETVKTRVQLTAHLKELGLTVDSKDFDEAFKILGKDLKLF